MTTNVFPQMFKTAAALALLCAVLQCQSYILQLSPPFIDSQKWQAVTLNCHPGNESADEMNPLRIGILREDEASNWNLIAEVEANRPGVTVYESTILTSGHVGDLNDSYLAVTWPVPKVDVLGTYRCDVFGYDLNQDPFQEKTSEVVIEERNSTGSA